MQLEPGGPRAIAILRRMPPASGFDVAGVGANSVDSVYVLPAYPQPTGANAKMPIRTYTIACGGQTATALATCASLGLRTKYVGVTGTDGNGRRIRAALTRLGVDLSDAVIRDAPNQFSVILLDEQHGERIVLWDDNERLRLRARELTADAIVGARAIHVDDLDEQAALRAAALGREAGALVTSDIDRVTADTRALVRSVTHPIFAEHVPAALTGERDLERALRSLRALNGGLLTVTLGARGAMALDGDRILAVPGFSVKVVDTTGAGDVFRGAFIHALLAGLASADILRFANAAAAVSCTRLGAMDGVPTLDEVGEILGA
jgi:sugar/nucleoside kinase (ribokinase family)